VHGQMRLDIQKQELKTKEWDIIHHADEAGLPDMYEVAAAFAKQDFAYLLETYKFVYFFFCHSICVRQRRVCRDAD
jgi:hypothetical protein